MARQQEKFTSDPMLPKTVIKLFEGGDQAVHEAIVSATTFENAAATLTLGAVDTYDFTAADPKGTLTVDASADEFSLPAGKWLFEVCLNIDNVAASVGVLGLAITDTVDSAAQVIHAQTPTALGSICHPSTSTYVQQAIIVHLTAQTSGIKVRAANTAVGAAGDLVVQNGSYVKISKLANSYDS